MSLIVKMHDGRDKSVRLTDCPYFVLLLFCYVICLCNFPWVTVTIPNEQWPNMGSNKGISLQQFISKGPINNSVNSSVSPNGAIAIQIVPGDFSQMDDKFKGMFRDCSMYTFDRMLPEDNSILLPGQQHVTYHEIWSQPDDKFDSPFDVSESFYSSRVMANWENIRQELKIGPVVLLTVLFNVFHMFSSNKVHLLVILSVSSLVESDTPKELAKKLVDYHTDFRSSEIFAPKTCVVPGLGRTEVLLAPIGVCPPSYYSDVSECKWLKNGKEEEVEEGDLVDVGFCGTKSIESLGKLSTCVSNQRTMDSFLESCGFLNRVKQSWALCEEDFYTTSSLYFNATLLNNDKSGGPNVKINFSDVFGRVNKFSVVRRPASEGFNPPLKQSFSGFLGITSACFHYDSYEELDSFIGSHLQMFSMTYVQISETNGQKACRGIKITVGSTDTERVDIDCKFSKVSLSSQSCKFTWGITKVIFKVEILTSVESVRVEIPPWAGFCTSEIDRSNMKTDGQLDRYIIVTCVFYSKYINDFAAGIYYKGMFDLTAIPKDDCGCLMTELCYRKRGSVIRLGGQNSPSDRYAGIEVLKTLLSATEDSTTSPLIKYCEGQLTIYGIICGYRSNFHLGSQIKLKSFIKDSQHLISSSSNGTLQLITSQKDKSFVPGIYTSKLNLTRTRIGLLHGSEDKEVLLTQYGKYYIDQCLENHNDGTELGYRNMLRCKRNTSQTMIILFWVTISSLIVILLFTIINFGLLMHSKYKKTSTWYIACLNYYSLFCPPNTEIRNKICSVSTSISSERDLVAVCKKTKKLFETTVINSRIISGIIKTVTLFPVMIIVVYTVLAIVWLCKLVLTLLAVPLKMCYGSMVLRTFTFTNVYQFIYGPAGCMPCFGCGKSQLRMKINKCDGPIVKSTAVSFIVASFGVWIILSSVFYATSAEGIGQSLTVESNCDYGRCTSTILLVSELFFSTKYSVSHPLISKETGKVDGHVKISIKNAEYHHLMTYQFTSPEFDVDTSRIVCKSNDKHFDQQCWGRWFNPEDAAEKECSNWGKQGADFISENKITAAGTIQECVTYGPKGFWWGLSAPLDGLEFIGLVVKEHFKDLGRRQWTLGEAILNGTIIVEVQLKGQKLIEKEFEINRLLDTHTIDSDLGTIKVDERRISGEDMTGKEINCEYENLIESSTPTCYTVGKLWEDEYNLNIVGEKLKTNDGIHDYNNLGLKRTGNIGCCGSMISFKNGNQPHKNYYAASSRVSVVSGCDTLVTSNNFITSEPVGRCSDKRLKTEKACTEAREAWGAVTTSFPSQNLILRNCLGMKLDLRLTLNLEYDSNSATPDSLDLSLIDIEIFGCYGQNGLVEVRVFSTEQKAGLIGIATSSVYVTCPPLHFWTVEDNTFNCTSGLKNFKLFISDPSGKHQNKRQFSGTIRTACASFRHDEKCEDCSGDLPQNYSDHWTWWEWLLLALGITVVIIIMVVVIAYSVPLAFSAGQEHKKYRDIMNAKNGRTLLPISNKSKLDIQKFYD